MSHGVLSPRGTWYSYLYEGPPHSTQKPFNTFQLRSSTQSLTGNVTCGRFLPKDTSGCCLFTVDRDKGIILWYGELEVRQVGKYLKTYLFIYNREGTIEKLFFFYLTPGTRVRVK